MPKTRADRPLTLRCDSRFSLFDGAIGAATALGCFWPLSLAKATSTTAPSTSMPFSRPARTAFCASAAVANFTKPKPLPLITSTRFTGPNSAKAAATDACVDASWRLRRRTVACCAMLALLPAAVRLRLRCGFRGHSL